MFKLGDMVRYLGGKDEFNGKIGTIEPDAFGEICYNDNFFNVVFDNGVWWCAEQNLMRMNTNIR